MVILLIEYLLLFSLLSIISSHIINYIFKNIEPLTNSNFTNPNTYINPNLNNDPLYLAKVNAANNTYLNNQVQKILNKMDILDSEHKQLKTNVNNNTLILNQTNKSLNKTANESLPSKKDFHNLVNQQSAQ